ncbi:MAG: alpha/beta fold hydrolase [Paracoccaceae bacterium]
MGEPLVLVPGMMCDARLFAPQIVALSAVRSIQIAPITGADSVAKLADLVLASAPERFALAGWSMGGGVAMEIQRRAPHRVTRLALMDTNCLGETAAASAAREESIVLAKSGRLAEVIRELIKPEDLAKGPHRREILEAMLRMALELGPKVYVRQSRALQRRPDQQKTLRKLKIPTLFLCGEHDQITPRLRHEFMSTLVVGSQLEIIANAGYLPTLEQPAKVTELLQKWLEQPLVLR